MHQSNSSPFSSMFIKIDTNYYDEKTNQNENLLSTPQSTLLPQRNNFLEKNDSYENPLENEGEINDYSKKQFPIFNEEHANEFLEESSLNRQKFDELGENEFLMKKNRNGNTENEFDSCENQNLINYEPFNANEDVSSNIKNEKEIVKSKKDDNSSDSLKIDVGHSKICEQAKFDEKLLNGDLRIKPNDESTDKGFSVGNSSSDKVFGECIIENQKSINISEESNIANKKTPSNQDKRITKKGVHFVEMKNEQNANSAENNGDIVRIEGILRNDGVFENQENKSIVSPPISNHSKNIKLLDEQITPKNSLVNIHSTTQIKKFTVCQRPHSFIEYILKMKLFPNQINEPEISNDFLAYNKELEEFYFIFPKKNSHVSKFNIKVYELNDKIDYKFRNPRNLDKNLFIVFDETHNEDVLLRYTNLNKLSFLELYNTLYSCYASSQVEKNSVTNIEIYNTFIIKHLSLFENNEKSILFEVIKAPLSVLSQSNKNKDFSLEFFSSSLCELFRSLQTNFESKNSYQEFLPEIKFEKIFCSHYKLMLSSYAFFDRKGDARKSDSFAEEINSLYFQAIKVFEMEKFEIDFNVEKLTGKNSGNGSKWEFQKNFLGSFEQLAKFSVKLKNYEQSNTYYKLLLEENENLANLWKYKLGKNFFHQGFFKKSLNILNFIKKMKTPETKHISTMLNIFGLAYKSMGEIDNCIKSYEELQTLLKRRDKKDWTLFNEADVILSYLYNEFANNKGQLKKAIKISLDALGDMGKIEKNDKNFKMMLNLVNIYLKLGELENCKNLLENIKNLYNISNENINFNYYLNYANYCFASGIYEDAEETLLFLSQNVINAKSQAKIQNILSLVYLKNGNEKLALQYINEAEESMESQEDLNILNNKITVHLKLGNTAKLGSLFIKIETLLMNMDSIYKEKLNYGNLLKNRATYYEIKEEFETALNDLEYAIEIFKKFYNSDHPTILEINLKIIRINLILDNTSRAKEICDKILESNEKINENLIPFLEKMAFLFNNFERFEEAAELFEKILKELQFEAESFEKIAFLFESLRKWEIAVHIWEKMLDYYKQKEKQEDIINALKKLKELYKKLKKDDKKLSDELDELTKDENKENEKFKKAGEKILLLAFSKKKNFG